MDTAGTTNWLNNRKIRPTLAHSRAANVRIGGDARDLLISGITGLRIPFWAFFATVMLAAIAVCATVVMSARGQLMSATSEYRQIATQMASLQRDNQRLELDISRITSDSNAIELAARERLGMVRPTDVVVPIESRTNSSSLGTVSTVH